MSKLRPPQTSQKGRCLGLRNTSREGKKEGIFASGLKGRAFSFIQEIHAVPLHRLLCVFWERVHVKARSGIAKCMPRCRDEVRGCQLAWAERQWNQARSLAELVPWLKVEGQEDITRQTEGIIQAAGTDKSTWHKNLALCSAWKGSGTRNGLRHGRRWVLSRS